LKRRELTSCTFKPKIAKKSSEYVGSKINTPVYDRLSKVVFTLLIIKSKKGIENKLKNKIG